MPNAWDDDWESQADQADEAENASSRVNAEVIKASRAERLAKHVETNKQIWESAEAPETFHFLAARDNVPLKAEFKPALKVLSRKPAPKVISRKDPITGISQMALEDEDEDDDESMRKQPTPDEIRVKAQKALEEKQKRYDEARARLLGPSETESGASSPRLLTPPAQVDEMKENRGKGRGRGSSRSDMRRLENQSGTRELFDPNHTTKRGSFTVQRRGMETKPSGLSSPRVEDQIIRAPRGPDGNGRGGFGFVSRDNKGPNCLS